MRGSGRGGRVLAQEGAVGRQPGLQAGDRQGAGRAVGFDGQRGRGAGRLAHDEASARDAGRGLPAVRHGRAAPGHQQVVHAQRQQHAVRQVVEATAVRDVLPLEADVAGHVLFDHPAVHADVVVEAGAAQHVRFGQLVLAEDAARLAHAHLGRDLQQVGVLEAGGALAQELEEVHDLAAPLHLGRAQLPRVRGVHGAAVRVGQLGHVGAPLAGVLLRPDDGRLAREAAAGGLGLCHQPVEDAVVAAHSRGVHAADAEHGRRVHHVVPTRALLEGRAGQRGQVAVASAVDEGLRQHRVAARSGLDQRGVDGRRTVHDEADDPGVEQQLRAAAQHQIVRRHLERGVVVGLRGDLAAEQRVRLLEPAQALHAIEQVVRHAVHHSLDVAVHVGVQAAEVGDAGGGAHAAQEAIRLDQQGLAASARGRGGGGDAGGATAHHDHVELAPDRG